MDFWITFAIIFGLLLLALYTVDSYQKRGKTFHAMIKFTGPPVYPIIGCLAAIAFKSPAKTFDSLRIWAKTYGGSYRFWITKWLFVINIIRVREVEPLLSSTNVQDGSEWLERRRLLTPTFHFNILTRFHEIFLDECERLLQTLESHASSGKPTELEPEMSHFALSTICETSMGVKLNSVEGAETYPQKLQEIGEMIVYRIMRPWLYNDMIAMLSGYLSAFQKITDHVHSFAEKIINQRREQFYHMSDKIEDISEENIYNNTKNRYAMLDTLFQAEMEGKISKKEIRDEVDGFIFGGHDTTTTALIFIFFQLAREPKVQEQMYQEIFEVRSRKPAEDKWFNQRDYAEMKFVNRAIKECLRMWPPVTGFSRIVNEDLILADEGIIPAGCLANVYPFDLHRDPEQFPNPEVFDADRFLPENIERRNPYAYIPFSAGPRNCLGQKYAMMQLRAVVTHTLLRFRVFPKTRLEEITFIADMVLRTTKPIEVKFMKH